MVTGVVDDHRELLSTPILAAEKTLQESVEGNPIEFAFFGLYAKASGSKVRGSPVSDLRPGRGRGDLGICGSVFLKAAWASASAPFGEVRGRNRRMPR